MERRLREHKDNEHTTTVTITITIMITSGSGWCSLYCFPSSSSSHQHIASQMASLLAKVFRSACAARPISLASTTCLTAPASVVGVVQRLALFSSLSPQSASLLCRGIAPIGKRGRTARLNGTLKVSPTISLSLSLDLPSSRCTESTLHVSVLYVCIEQAKRRRQRLRVTGGNKKSPNRNKQPF
jgi:hypothetical protein